MKCRLFNMALVFVTVFVVCFASYSYSDSLVRLIKNPVSVSQDDEVDYTSDEEYMSSVLQIPLR